MDNLVFSNMLHRPARTFVSILGIAIGVLLIVFTIGMANGTLRERANREGNVGAEIIFSASGASLLSSDSFLLPINLKDEIDQTRRRSDGRSARTKHGQSDGRKKRQQYGKPSR